MTTDREFTREECAEMDRGSSIATGLWPIVAEGAAKSVSDGFFYSGYLVGIAACLAETLGRDLAVQLIEHTVNTLKHAKDPRH